MKFIGLLVALSVTLLALVDVNHASQKELTKLKGIGTKKAAKIIDYRTEHCFQNVKELMRVKGVGKKILEKNINNLEAKPCKVKK
ncbi:MAG: helix-hairpin-helix domain-containing protein [Helicobacteraceae bacterium]|nr:helix-hairpin-helix domain-containing protein [Helicobacteraceae bacterium]